MYMIDNIYMEQVLILIYVYDICDTIIYVLTYDQDHPGAHLNNM